MPVSYLSKSAETTPYVLPVDLNLLAKVDSYKQSMFYQNAQKIEQQIGSIQNSDIANPTQREYLNGAVNSVLKKIDDYGAIDYSDMNVSNSIENLGSEVYKDENVINAISSTKKMRTLQQNYQKMANDPKLSKYYNTAYETYDYEHYIKPYISSTNVKAFYEGPANPTIYTGNPLDKAAKLIKQAHPEIVAEVVNGKATGGYINIQTKERYTPAQLSSTFDSLIDGQLKTELIKNAWYTLDFSNRKADGTSAYDESDYVDILNRQSDKYLSDLNAELKAHQELLVRAGLNTDTKTAAQNRIAELTKTINSVQEAATTNEKAFRNVFKKDKDSALYQLYVNGIKHDLYDIFGAEQTKVSLKPDLDKAFEQRKEIAYISQGYKYLGINPLDGSPRLEIIPGGKADKKKDKGDGSALSGFTALQSNFETGSEAEANALTVNKIKADNDLLNGQVSAKLEQVIYKAALESKGNNNGTGTLWNALGYTDNPNNNAGSSPITGSSKILNYVKSLSGSSSLEIDDLRKAVSITEANPNQGNRLLNTGALTPQAYKYMKGIVDSYDQVVKDKNFDKPIPKDVQEFVDLYHEKKQLVDANKTLLESTRAKVESEIKGKLTAAEYKTLDDFYKNPSAYKHVKYSGYQGADVSYVLNTDMVKLLGKAGLSTDEDAINQKINKQLANASNRENYGKIYFSSAENEKDLKNILPGLNNFILDANKEVINNQKVSVDDVVTNNIYYSPTGWKLSYAIKDNGKLIYSDPTGTYKLKDLDLTPEQAKIIGAQAMPYPEFEKAAYIKGEAFKDYVVPTFLNVKDDGTVSKNAAPIKIRVFSADNSRNNRFWYAQVYSPTTGQYETIPYDAEENKYGGSANGAYWFAQSKLNTYATSNDPTFGTIVPQTDGTVAIVRNVDSFIEQYVKPRK